MDFTRFMNKFNEIERQLSPTSALRLSFDNISPESEEPPDGKRLWGVPVPPFVSDKVVSWIEEEFNEAPVYYNGNCVLKKVLKANPEQNETWGASVNSLCFHYANKRRCVIKHNLANFSAFLPLRFVPLPRLVSDILTPENVNYPARKARGLCVEIHAHFSGVFSML